MRLKTLSYRIRFGAPDANGEQPLTVLRAAGESARSGADGEPLAQGQTNEEVASYDRRAYLGRSSRGRLLCRWGRGFCL